MVTSNYDFRPVDMGLDGAVGGDALLSHLVNGNGNTQDFVLSRRPWVTTNSRGEATGVFKARRGGMAKDGKPVLNAVPTQNVSGFLRYDDWVVLDQAIVKAAKFRLKAVADLRGMGLQFTIPNGLGRTMLYRERQSDINEAVISMNGLRQSQNDRPVFDVQALPLPIIHKDFSFSARDLMASRNGGSPLDTTTAELAARRVAETAEQLLTGNITGPTYETAAIYGYTNHPNKLSATLTSPTASAWTAQTTVNQVLGMRYQCQNAKHFGPFMLYASLDWDQYLDEDYKPTYNATTLRQRLRAIEGIIDVKTLDYLPAKTMVLVQMTPDTVREVVGMEITTVQWETQGGMEVNFKVMAILVPDLRSDYNSNMGLCVGTYT